MTKNCDESDDHFTCVFESDTVKNKECCSSAVIGGNNWDKARERVKSSSSSGELVKALAELFHHCQSPWGLSLSSVQLPTSPLFPSISLSPHLCLSLSQSHPSLYPCHLFITLKPSLSFYLFYFCQAVYTLQLISLSLLLLLLLLSFFLCWCLFLSLLPPYLLGQWQCVSVGGGIDLTLCCSSHRAVWHSAYVIQMSLKCVCM